MRKSREYERRPLTYEDRIAIEAGLGRGDRISSIARMIGRAPKVVASEIRRNWTDSPKGTLTVTTRNICVHRSACDHRDVCKKGCLMACNRCRSWACNSACPDFEAEMCPKHETAPYCCNSCSQRLGAGCRYPYRFYEARYAEDCARIRRSEARTGIDCDQESFEAAMQLLKKGLRNGQSPAHVIETSEAIPFSTSSFYRYVGNGGAKGIIKMDLPRAVRYRPRSKTRNGANGQIPREMLKGRTYDDFKVLDERLKANAVEGDTVVGRLGTDRQCILTLYFRRFHFQLFILLREHTTECVVEAIDTLDDLCGGLFAKLVPVLILDRGTEFSDVKRIENRKNGTPRTKVFFCDANNPGHKGGCEKNHVELRRILPKGRTNFDALTGRDMAACMSHVNSYCRASIDWWSPIQMARLVLPASVLEAYGIEEIPPAEVNLTPYLVPHAMISK